MRTQQEKDAQSARIIKIRVGNLDKLIKSLLETQWDNLERLDVEDLEEAALAIARVLRRY